MRRKQLILRSLIALALVWALVIAVRAVAGGQRVTAAKVESAMEVEGLADWSELDAPPDAAAAERREERLREVAAMVNELDFAEREKLRDRRSGEEFFHRLATREKELFVDLTIEKSMRTFFRAVDALEPDERQRFVEDGLREIESGRTEEDMKRLRDRGKDMLERAPSEGMEAYFENASAETKLDLAPLMEAMDEVMKGLRGNDFGQRP